MFKPVYLMQSRHNVYYFRWPMPKTPANPKLEHIRLSLKTREPQEALRLAKLLEYHGLQITEIWGASLMNNNEAKAIIQAYFQAILEKRKNIILEHGPLPDERIAQINASLKDAEEFIDLAKQGVEVEDDDTIAKINRAMGLKIDPLSTDADKLKANYNQAYPAMLREVLRFNNEHGSFDFSPQKHAAPSNKPKAKYTLDEIGQKFIDMHMKEKLWDENTRKEKLSYISTLQEIVGDKFNILEMDAEGARNVRDIVQKIPVNRSKKAKIKNLSLMKAIEVKGLEPIAPATVKKYLDCYKSLFGWCMNECYIDRNPFQTIKGRVALKKPDEERGEFSEEQIKTMLEELDSRRLAKKDYAYWGTLIGIYTGARVNEVAQIMLDDIKQDNGVWYFDMNDDEGKKLKNKASRRKVPIHQSLLDRGLIEHRDTLKKKRKDRLLHELTFCPKNGYGRNLSRFFNQTFLVKLGMKSKQHVFHSLRHTVVTRLTQAGHDEKKVKAIIGHTQSGTALTTYFKGFKMYDLKSVIDTLHIS